MSDQHEKFLKRYDASWHTVFLVGERLHAVENSCDVLIRRRRRAPTAAVHMDYVDSGDLFADNHRYEVKGLQDTLFTSMGDWPHPDVFVSKKEAADRAAGKVAAYALVSTDLSHMALIDIETRRDWYERTKRASNTGNRETYYCCPRDLIKVYPL